MAEEQKPLALLVFPPIYDFALYDLYLKPYSLLRIGKWLACWGYRIHFVNCMDYHDPHSVRCLGRPRRESNGTGKFFRQVVEKPAALTRVRRRFARYGIVREALEAKLRQVEPDLILLSSGMTYWYLGVAEVVQTIRHIHPRVPIVLGGVYASLCTQHARQNIEVDFVVAGQAYPGLCPALQRWSLPVPQAPPEETQYPLRSVLSDAAVLRMNTGCPYRCQYCASRRLDGALKLGSWQTAYRAVQQLHRDLGTKNFAFYDDALLADKERVIVPFLESIIASQLSLNFYVPNGLHIAFIDDQVARLMRAAGFREVRLGMESSKAAFHRSYDCKLDPVDLAVGVDCLRTAGFKPWEIGVYVLAGLPRQSRVEVEESLRFAARLKVRLYVAEYSPIPGSPLWTESVRASSYPLEEEPLTHNNTVLPLQWAQLTPSDLEELKGLSRSLSARQEV